MQEFNNGDGVLEVRRISVIGKPVRLFEWVIAGGAGKEKKTITIMEVSFEDEDDPKGSNIYVPVWDTDADSYDRVTVLGKTYPVDLEENPFAIPWTGATRKTYERMVELVQKSPRVVLNIYLLPPEMVKTMTNRTIHWTDSFEEMTYPAWYWQNRGMDNSENYAKQDRWMREMEKEGKSSVERVWFGFNGIGFLTDEPIDQG